MYYNIVYDCTPQQANTANIYGERFLEYKIQHKTINALNLVV